MRALFALPDALRRGALRIAAPLVAPLYARRELRVAWLGSIAIVVSLALSLAYPLALLSLGPLLLGVPHLLSDVRYLVVKPRAHARWSLVLFVLVPLAATWVSPTLKVGLVATLGAALVARAPWPKKIVALTLGGALYGVAYRLPEAVGFAFAHAHNFIAAALLLAFSRSVRHALVPTAIFVSLSLALVFGALDPLLSLAAMKALPRGADFALASWQYAPFCSTTECRLRFVALFVFAQSVHYTIWLRLLPDEARSRPGMHSFVSSFRTLRRDVGALGLFGFAVAALVFVVWGLRALEDARIGYLRFAAFHSYLELAFLTLLALEGRATWLPDAVREARRKPC